MSRPLKTQSRARRRVRLIGGYVPRSLFHGISLWTAQGQERSLSGFLREAIREKLAGDGISFAGPVAPGPVSKPGPGGESQQISQTQ